MNTYEFILRAKEEHLWEGNKFLFARAHTLERYSSIYAYILEHAPEKKYGTIPKILNDPEFTERFGNQYDEPLLYKVIHVMEQSLPN